jgi:hypothetical protein
LVDSFKRGVVVALVVVGIAVAVVVVGIAVALQFLFHHYYI